MIEALSSALHGPLWPLLAFALLWLGGAALIARFAGWHSLAKRFPVASRPSGHSFRFTTASLGSSHFPMKYSRCLHLVVNDAGFYLALMFPFKFHSPAVFVPWSGIEAVQEKQLFATKSFTFCFFSLWPRLTLAGPVGEFVKAAHANAATNAA